MYDLLWGLMHECNMLVQVSTANAPAAAAHQRFGSAVQGTRFAQLPADAEAVTHKPQSWGMDSLEGY